MPETQPFARHVQPRPVRDTPVCSEYRLSGQLGSHLPVQHTEEGGNTITPSTEKEALSRRFMRQDGNVENRTRVHRIEQCSIVVMNEFVAVLLHIGAVDVVKHQWEYRRTLCDLLLHN